MKLPFLPKLPKIGRETACVLALLAVFSLYILRLVDWQIVRGQEFREESMRNNMDSMEITPARGEILDKNGVELAGNRTSYDLIYDALKMVYSERNTTIVRVVSLLEERGEKWRDILPIEVDEEGGYVFSENREGAIASLKEDLSLAEYATAEDCMAALIEEYNCFGYSSEDTRVMASVRYSMTKDGYSRTNPYVIARDVSAETIGVFRERQGEFPGIEGRVSVARYYGDESMLAAHVVGELGMITDTQYAAAEENGTAYDSETNPAGYRWTDEMGRSGMELAFESELRGKRGKKSILLDEAGELRSITVTESAEEGHTIHTTLDTDLQRAAMFSLEENIKANSGYKKAKDCKAGAAVVLDVKNFGVLACASYPGYDLNKYMEDDAYKLQLLNDEDTKPLNNRALEGVYTPGSVFKPMVALAALQEGIVTADSTPYNCDMSYRYADLTLACTGEHGYANIYSAMAGSCNAYFCDVGMNLTIRRMDAYAEYFALGTATGIELPEALGTMSSPQEYEESHQAPWTDGLTPQTAIGQCDNAFTPIQLATYCATIANGGVRMRTHFLDHVTNYTRDEVLRRYEPEVLSDAGLSGDVLSVVQEAMRQVAASPAGTAYGVFGDYPYGVAAKTGTAELDSGVDAAIEPNLTFIAYAPIEDPQIAVAVVLERGYKGDYAQRVAKAIVDQYFGLATWDTEGNRYNSDGDKIDREWQVVKTKEELDEEEDRQESAGTSSGTEDGTLPEAGLSSEPSGGRDEGIPDTPFTGDATPAPTESPSPENSGGASESSSVIDFPYWNGENRYISRKE